MRSALILSSALVCGSLLSGNSNAAETATTNSNAIVAPLNGASANTQESETQIGARFALLKELVSTHERRAQEARKENEGEKAKWEEDLVRELSGRVNEAASALEQFTRERIATKTAAKEPTAPIENLDESAFLTRIDTHLWRIEEDIRLAVQVNTGLSSQLQTNNTPEELLRVSFVAQENNALVRALERERSHLELQKLQYHALRSTARTK